MNHQDIGIRILRHACDYLFIEYSLSHGLFGGICFLSLQQINPSINVDGEVRYGEVRFKCDHSAQLVEAITVMNYCMHLM